MSAVIPTTSDVINPAWVEIQPEKQYDTHDCCYATFTGGGHKKLKLYSDHVLYEEYAPCCPLWFAMGPPGCVLFLCTLEEKKVIRKPYDQVLSVITSSTMCAPHMPVLISHSTFIMLCSSARHMSHTAAYCSANLCQVYV